MERVAFQPHELAMAAVADDDYEDDFEKELDEFIEHGEKAQHNRELPHPQPDDVKQLSDDVKVTTSPDIMAKENEESLMPNDSIMEKSDDSRNLRPNQDETEIQGSVMQSSAHDYGQSEILSKTDDNDNEEDLSRARTSDWVKSTTAASNSGFYSRTGDVSPSDDDINATTNTSDFISKHLDGEQEADTSSSDPTKLTNHNDSRTEDDEKHEEITNITEPSNDDITNNQSGFYSQTIDDPGLDASANQSGFYADPQSVTNITNTPTNQSGFYSKSMDGDQSDEQTDNEDDYVFSTDDQLRAMEELERLRSEMDDGLPDHDPPEYDVRDRLKQLNEELAADTTSIDEIQNRERMVAFKDNLVDLVVPPEDDDYDDEDEVKTERTDDEVKTERTDDEAAVATATDNTETSGDEAAKPHDKVLVEIEGNFELLDSDDVRAQGLALPSDDPELNYDPSPNDSTPEVTEQPDENIGETTEDNRRESDADLTTLAPHPPPVPRPVTANGTSHRQSRSGSQRAHSAQYAPDMSFYHSPYGLTPNDKERKMKVDELKLREERESERKHQEEEREKRQWTDSCFTEWLRKKREEKAVERKAELERRKQSPSKDRLGRPVYNDDHDYFAEWVQKKSKEMKIERLLQRRAEEAEHACDIIHTHEDCQLAFKEWKKKKNKELRLKRSQERQIARVHILTARRTKKSHMLARAIQQSQSFRYIDYYGYSF